MGALAALRCWCRQCGRCVKSAFCNRIGQRSDGGVSSRVPLFCSWSTRGRHRLRSGRRGGTALWHLPSLGKWCRGSLRGIRGLLVRRLLQLGVLLAQPVNGALQLDDLPLELRFSSSFDRCCRLSGCGAGRASSSRSDRFGRCLYPVLRAKWAADPLLGTGSGVRLAEVQIVLVLRAIGSSMIMKACR